MICCNFPLGVPDAGLTRELELQRELKRSGLLDRMAIGLSGLCILHCVASAIVVAMLASAGGLLLDHRVHEIGLMLAMGLGALSLGSGILAHGFLLPSAVGALGLALMAVGLAMPHNGAEMLFTIIGVGIVALGHELNRRAHR